MLRIVALAAAFVLYVLTTLASELDATPALHSKWTFARD
jgi:hypothetical protein